MWSRLTALLAVAAAVLAACGSQLPAPVPGTSGIPTQSPTAIPSAAPTPSPTPTPQLTFSGKVVTEGGGRIRSGPGMDQRIAGLEQASLRATQRPPQAEGRQRPQASRAREAQAAGAGGVNEVRGHITAEITSLQRRADQLTVSNAGTERLLAKLSGEADAARSTEDVTGAERLERRMHLLRLQRTHTAQEIRTLLDLIAARRTRYGIVTPAAADLPQGQV